MVHLEIINTGSELLLGRVLNTHQQWLCRQLSQMGYEVNRQMLVPDTGPAIEQAVRESLGRANIVITTGGLGPTSDDLTRDFIAKLLGKKLVLDSTVLEAIQEFYSRRQRPMPESTRVQALVPEGARVLPNPHGTAPGLALSIEPEKFRSTPRPALLLMLPGPPRELCPMFMEHAAPLIRQTHPLDQPYFSMTLKTACLGESVIEEKIGRSLDALIQAGLDVGYCARLGEVEVRLGGRGDPAKTLVQQGAGIVRSQLPPCIFGTGDDRLEDVIVRLLSQQKCTLVTAESCTGGLVAHRLTNVSGASAVLLCGLVTYSNESKCALLGVPEDIIAAHGAVSEPTARAMAEGARQRYGADYAVALTGIAGPTGGTPEKPAGTVYIAVASAQSTEVQHYLNRWDRESFKQVASQQALELLRQKVLKESGNAVGG